MKNRNISIIVAVDENFGIGINNQLLCHLPNDLKRFKKITSWHKVVMGKNTYFSLPFRPLPNRINIVLSDKKTDKFNGCAMAYSLEEVLNFCDKDETFIMGGASVYKTFLPYANKIYLTRIHHVFNSDVFFPILNFDDWKILKQKFNNKDDNHAFDYSFQDLSRKNM